MKKTLFTMAFSMVLCANASVLCAQNKNTTPEVNKEAVAQLDTYTKYAGAGSLAAIGAGFLLKKDLLTGLGLGTLGGLSVGVFQKNYNWIVVWLAESIARNSLTRGLCTTNISDVPLTPVEVITLERNMRSYVNLFASHQSAARREQMLADIMVDAHVNAQKAKALRTIMYSAQGASWISYLIYRYLEQKAEQSA